MPRKANLTCDTSEKPFARALSNLMQETGTTQPKLAEYVGCTRQAISLYTTGQSTPDIYTLQKIAKFFDVSYEYLLGETEAKRTEYIQIKSVLSSLSEEAIYTLIRLCADDMRGPILNRCLECRRLMNILLVWIFRYAKDREKRTNDKLWFLFDFIKTTGLKHNKLEVEVRGVEALSLREQELFKSYLCTILHTKDIRADNMLGNKDFGDSAHFLSSIFNELVDEATRPTLYYDRYKDINDTHIMKERVSSMKRMEEREERERRRLNELVEKELEKRGITNGDSPKEG